MGYVDESLAAGESVQYRGRFHRAPALTPAWVVVLGLLLFSLEMHGQFSILDLFNPGILGSVIAIVGMGLLISSVVALNAYECAITDRRIVVKTGVFRRHTIEVRLSKVETVSVDQSILGRCLDYGNVIIRGTGGTTEVITALASPLEFHRCARESVETFVTR